MTLSVSWWVPSNRFGEQRKLVERAINIKHIINKIDEGDRF